VQRKELSWDEVDSWDREQHNEIVGTDIAQEEG